MRTTEGTLPTDYTFTGQKLDASSGLMYYGARYYDAAIGRFVQPDSIISEPLNPQSLNRYAYTLNNPVRYRDPSGHCAEAANTSRGCPSWMPDLAFGGLDLVMTLTVSATAYAPAEEGRFNYCQF